MAVVWKKLAFEGDVVLEADFDATTFLYATLDNTPQVKTPAEVMAILSGEAGAEFLFNTQKVGGVVDPTTDQQAATKKYVDDQVGGVNEFTELTDTPGAYAGEAGKLVAVNATPDALEFILQSSLKLDDFGTPDDNTDLDAVAATRHGLFAKLDKDKLDAIDALADVTGDNPPQAHHDTHDPEDGGDALDCAAPAELAGVQAAGEGSAHEFARADHAHQIQHSIADNHLVTIDGADLASGEIARFTVDGLESRTPAEVAATMALDDISVPDAPVDFDLQEATDLVVMKVADAATRNALAAAATEVGQLLWQTDTGELYACTESS